jgi:hypothetical protein
VLDEGWAEVPRESVTTFSQGPAPQTFMGPGRTRTYFTVYSTPAVEHVLKTTDEVLVRDFTVLYY